MIRVEPMEGYRIWAKAYDSSPNPLLELESAALPQHFGTLAGKMFADVGCGTGRWAQYARRRGARVMAMDLSHEMLIEAAAKPELAGTLVRAAAEALPAPGSIMDITVCSFAIAYLQSLAGFAREAARISRPGASVVVTDMHPAALQAGWKRSFRGPAETYELEHATYSQAQILAAFDDAGLRLEFQTEAYFGKPQFETFRRAGKESAFAEVCRIPALWIGMWRKA